MAILTIKNRHARAASYKEEMETAGMWFGFGKTTAWTDDTQPPAPQPSDTDIQEAIGYKKADMITFVKEDPNGSIYYLGDTYSAIEDTEAETNSSTLLYVRAVVNYDELPPSTYRQIGIFRGLTPTVEAGSSAKVLLPSQVQSKGTLDIIDNIMPSSRAQYQRDEYSYMIQF